jgi:hypothetical protein
MTRFKRLTFCVLATVSSACAFGDDLVPNLNDALKCPDGMAAVKSCSQYRQAQDQNLWIRLCEVPGTTSPTSATLSLVLATKTADLYSREVAAYSGFNANTNSVVFLGAESPVKCDGDVSGPCSSYFEYQYSRPKNQPYDSAMNTLLNTRVKNGDATTNLGISIQQNQFNCWAEKN